MSARLPLFQLPSAPDFYKIKQLAKKFIKLFINATLYTLFLIIATFAALEIVLRIFHPFPLRLKGDKIVLPQSQVYRINNVNFARLDKKIVHTKNSLGFRGEEKPDGFENYLSIVTVGGSTTECFYIDDKKDWPSRLGDDLKKNFHPLWTNNAGLEGHSTFGHQVLLDDYLVKLKPKLVLFLTGINDVGIENLRAEEIHNLASSHKSSFFSDVANYSEAFNLFRVIQKVRNAQKMNLVDNKIDIVKLDKLVLPRKTIKKMVSEQIPHSLNYKKRLLKLIETCRKNNIEPVLITQPCLYGVGVDSLTGINLETIKIDKDKNGIAGWKILQLYNEQAKSAGKETNTFVIDLAGQMPKNAVYYYDLVHFTNEGCSKVAEIISNDISPFLQNKYSAYYKQ